MLVKAEEKVVIVTGANRGIGYSIVHSIIAQNLPYHVILCSRTAKNGEAAITSLLEAFPEHPKTHLTSQVLDISSPSSISAFKETFLQKYKKVDIIVNNAGFVYMDTKFTPQILRDCFATNCDGSMNFQSEMSTLMQKNGKVVYFSS